MDTVPGEGDGPDQTGSAPRGRIPLRQIVPNLVTILSICAGMTGIRFAFEGRIELAVVLVLGAAFLDGIDGRIARLVNGQSRFGAEMDSLRKTIEDLKSAIDSSKERQKAAKQEISKLEKDMSDFKNNKDGKINELKV